jgi:hypothetical protein
MKTMLNRNFIKKGIFINGLLIVMAIITTSATRLYSGSRVLSASNEVKS